MTSPDTPATAANSAKSMDDIVALCRRRGFIWQSSEIYGGINGFWDYGPLGAELKRNLKDAWWHDIIRCPPKGPDGDMISMVPVDCTIIMNPKVWIASGHVAGFNDPMMDDRDTQRRYRADQLFVFFPTNVQTRHDTFGIAVEAVNLQEAEQRWDDLHKTGAIEHIYKLASKQFGFNPDEPMGIAGDSGDQLTAEQQSRTFGPNHEHPGDWVVGTKLTAEQRDRTIAPSAKKFGTLMAARQFNLMYQTYNGPIQSDENKVYLRPETAQGIFCNFKNVLDTSRVKVPFGIAQVGKAFRNEVTPRNFTFRSREFEQMEIEFFIRPDAAKEWYAWWRDARYAWWQAVGLAGENLQLREHDRDELAHYAKDGAGTSDIEYRFPFTSPGFGELEGVAHRTDFDLRQHAEHSGLGDKLKYFDQERNERYFPHVIEPSAGADRGTLALLCEAYTPDATRPSGVYMKFTPRMAPIKAAVFPLVNKDGMPEVAEKLYLDLRQKWAVQFDVKQTIGKRYARMDEAGTPYCFTVDGDTLKDQTVTVRHRDTQQQERIALDKVSAFLAEKLA